jgi:hypothetical protein
VITNDKGPEQAESQKDADRTHTRLHERANAQLKTWRILRELRCCPRRTGRSAKPSPSYGTARLICHGFPDCVGRSSAKAA